MREGTFSGLEAEECRCSGESQVVLIGGSFHSSSHNGGSFSCSPAVPLLPLARESSLLLMAHIIRFVPPPVVTAFPQEVKAPLSLNSPVSSLSSVSCWASD